MKLAASIIAAGILAATVTAQEKAKPTWPDFVREVQITSTADGTPQPAIFYAPESEQPVPLLVSLHTWGGTYMQIAGGRARWCKDQKWAFMHPHFRGPNNTPQAMGSDLAVQDILDAVEYAKAQAKIDTDRIYLVGFSGGGHAAMLMAGRAPEVWAGVSAWCGISDLKKWHAQNPGYGRSVAAAVQGNPQEDPKAAAECARRSPVTWLHQAGNVPLDIAAGIHDGHTGSVPISQSLEAFNLLAAPGARVSDEDIAYMTKMRAIPEHLQAENGGGELLRRARIHFRRQSGNARITIFEGGHTGIDAVALPWLAQQRKGKPAVWVVDVAKEKNVPGGVDEAAIGK